MADTNKGQGRVARRSARVFESDIDIRQSEDYGSDTGAAYHRKRGDIEHSQERDIKAMEKTSTRTRTPSMSSLAATDEVILGGLEMLAREKDSDAIALTTDQAKKAKPKTPGRPKNFGFVAPGIYRSGYPEADDHDFLKDLGLKTIVTLVDKDHPEGYQTFMQSSGIKHVVIKMEGTKKVDIPEQVMNTILSVVLDKENHPLLIHCNQGRHRTGCTVAAIRRAMGWSVDSILSEYTAYAEPKVREVDVNYIERFRGQGHVDLSVPHAGSLTTATKPRHITKTRKRLNMLFVTLAVMAVFMMTYAHERLTCST